MIIQKDFLNRLRDFGLNSYESKLWTALLSRGVSTAGELSDIANVPRSRSYDVLESLEKKGFVIMKLGKPIKYLAVEPEEVVSRVKKRIRKEADIQERLIDELKSSPILKELTLLHSKGIELVDPMELTGTIKGRDALYTHLSSGFKKAEKFIFISTTGNGISRKYDALKGDLEKASKRGVKIKILAPVNKDSQKAVKDLSRIAEIRNNSTNGRFFVIDGKEAVFMISDDENIAPAYDTGVWVKSGFFANSLGGLFNIAWKSK